MKHSYSNDDFLNKKSSSCSGDISNTNHELRNLNKYDIGSQFEEFLQKRNAKPGSQCMNNCRCSSCINFENLMHLDRMRHMNYDRENIHQNQHNNFFMANNKSGFCMDQVMNNNLNKYNTPASPYTPCS